MGTGVDHPALLDDDLTVSSESLLIGLSGVPMDPGVMVRAQGYQMYRLALFVQQNATTGSREDVVDLDIVLPAPGEPAVHPDHGLTLAI